MSTATTNIIFSNDTDAHFRAWCQWIHDRLAAFGWVNTSDTGQINLATIAFPASGSLSKGYEIWRMADTLQATKPIFLKIEYGSGTSGATAPAIWLTIGVGSDGAGTLTGNTTLRTHVYSVTAPSNTVTYAHYASGDTNRCVFAMCMDNLSTQSCGFIFGIERAKDTAGADNSEGGYIFAIHNTSQSCFHQMLAFSGPQPIQETYYLTGIVPANTTQSTGVVGADIHTYPILPEGFYPRNPIMNAVIYFNVDILRETSFTLDIYGANHTYLPCGQPVASSGPNYSSSDRSQSSSMRHRCAIRYE